MFPEFRDLISKLKTEDAHFTRLFDKHNELDQQIKNIENRIESGSAVDIENLKKEKAEAQRRAVRDSESQSSRSAVIHGCQEKARWRCLRAFCFSG